MHVENGATGVAGKAVQIPQRPSHVLVNHIATESAKPTLVLQITRIAADEYLIALCRLIGHFGVVTERLIDQDNGMVVAVQHHTLDRHLSAID